jgi:hypothetical protein
MAKVRDVFMMQESFWEWVGWVKQTGQRTGFAGPAETRPAHQTHSDQTGP